MIPFARMIKYGNVVTPPAQIEYMLSSGENSYLFFDPITGNLYVRGAGKDVGSATVYNVFTLTATNVKRILTTRGGGSVFHAYLSNDNKVYFTGNDACVKGSVSTTTAYVNWVDKTSMFTSAGISLDDIKYIQAFYNLKLNVVMKNGDLYCCGKNNTGTKSSFGTGTNVDSNYTFVKVPLSDVKHADGNLYLTNDGSLYRTGTNDQYQYGNNTTVSSPGLTKIVDSGVIDIYQGFQSSMYIDSTGVLYGCGVQFGTSYGNEFGTGTGGPYTYKTFTSLHSDSVMVSGCIGNMGTCIVTNNNILYSTGLNSNGSFGNGSTANASTWVMGNNVNIDLNTRTIVARANQGTMVWSNGKLYQAGIRYGTGLGIDSVFAEVPLTFLI